MVSWLLTGALAMAADKGGSSCTEGVDLNHADSGTLVHYLRGVGESRARAIVDYREANGPFLTTDEIIEVEGVSLRIWENNRDILRVEVDSGF